MPASNPSFPRGLSQPEQGFRFSVDALLLACFAEPRHGDRLLDLGTGCGVVALGALLRRPALELRALGLDSDPSMVGHAQDNARKLGLGARFTALCMDVRHLRGHGGLEPESFDLVLVNPPYRSADQGRTPGDRSRHRARFESGTGLDGFLSAAAFALKNRSRCALVHLAERCPEVFARLRAHRLEPKRVRFVHGREDSPARLALIEARKNGRPELRVEPPLILYCGREQGNRVHPRALAFCPFLDQPAGGLEEGRE